MKKMKHLSLILCLVILMQCLLLPVSATETTDTQPAAETTEETVDSAQQQSTAAFGSVCIQNGCRGIDSQIPLGGSERRVETSQSSFIFETTTNTLIYAYNPDVKVSPGTLTKMVAALVAIENCELDEIVTCSDGIQSKIPYGSANVKLKSQEQLSVEELLYCVMMQNANDATVALAEHVAGTTTAYVSLMNARVKQMGCTSTEFGNVSGLDTATSYTTARDMAKIIMEASKNETFATIFGTTSHTVPATSVSDARKLECLNYLIDESVIAQFYDRRVTGGMQSMTDASGASVVCTANSNNMNLVCVVLGATRVYEENGWLPKSYGNFNEMVELLDYAFNGYKVNRIVYEGMAMEQFPVSGGESRVVGQANVDVDSVVPASVSMDNLTTKTSVSGGGLSAPVKKDSCIATVQIWYRNSCLTEVELFAMSDVKTAANNGVTIKSTASLNDSDSGGFMSVLGTVCVIILGLAMAYLAYNSYMRSRMRARRRKRRQNRRRSR